jgi:hypothetical protein
MAMLALDAFLRLLPLGLSAVQALEIETRLSGRRSFRETMRPPRYCATDWTMRSELGEWEDQPPLIGTISYISERVEQDGKAEGYRLAGGVVNCLITRSHSHSIHRRSAWESGEPPCATDGFR